MGSLLKATAVEWLRDKSPKQAAALGYDTLFALGPLLAILVWVYYSGLILFFGAELTQVYANRHGSGARPGREARPLQGAVMEEHGAPDRAGAGRPGSRPRRASRTRLTPSPRPGAARARRAAAGARAR